MIKNLSGEAGTGHARAGMPLDRALLLAVAVALALAIVLVFLLFGVSDALLATMRGGPFQHKVASALLIAAGGFFLVRNAARPDGGRLPVLALLPGVVLLALGGVTDASGLPVLGRSGVSVPICLIAIVAVSLPALALIIAAVRKGASTRPTAAGIAAGLLSGALGAAAYALACKNDGGLFVAVWDSVGILIVAALGGAIGRRALAW
ncbi:NrsF family protein [Beijerinckia sp. L45]|uniref:NrsF family protein n=1 Tax=Beijerinckia sp. L45 TaxID=1641855 RepID=UPI001FF00B97|nr:NrsF family protein [Beijerinckia sp. L45]